MWHKSTKVGKHSSTFSFYILGCQSKIHLHKHIYQDKNTTYIQTHTYILNTSNIQKCWDLSSQDSSNEDYFGKYSIFQHTNKTEREIMLLHWTGEHWTFFFKDSSLGTFVCAFWLHSYFLFSFCPCFLPKAMQKLVSVEDDRSRSSKALHLKSVTLNNVSRGEAVLRRNTDVCVL